MPSRIRPVEFEIWPAMKYWSNWVEIHCMPPWLNWVSSLWITPNLKSISCPVEFDRAWNTAQNGCKFTGYHPYRLTPNLSNISCLVELGIIPINGFTPNSTSQIWPAMKYCSNWVEIHGFTPNLSSISYPVELGIIPMNSTGIYLNGFTPNSTSRIWPGMKYYSKFTGYHPYRLTPNLSSISCPVELGIIPINGFTPNSTGQIRPGMKYCSNWVEIHGFTPNLSSISCSVKLGIIPMNSTGIYLNGFTPNSTGQIRPGMKYCSKWV